MRHLIGIFSIISLLFSFIAPSHAFAQSPEPTPVIVAKQQTIPHTYLVTGSVVDIEGTVNGDLYAAGGTVLVNGTVNGDILAAGGTVTIRGTVQNVRVVGGQVSVDGIVKGSTTVLGGTIIVGDAAHINGSLVGAGGQVDLLGPIGKTVHLAAGQIAVQDTIGSDVSLAAGQVTLTPSAKINGSLWYQSQNQLSKAGGAVVTGKITHAYPPKEKVSPERQTNPLALLAGAKFVFGLYSVLIGLLVGLALFYWAPAFTSQTLSLLHQKLWMSFGIGILLWIITPFLLLLLVFTIIGIPFAFAWVILLILFTYVGKIIGDIFIGTVLLQRISHKYHVVWGLVIGLIVLEIISWIPLIGGLFSLFVVAIGFGAVAIQGKKMYVSLRRDNLL